MNFVPAKYKRGPQQCLCLLHQAVHPDGEEVAVAGDGHGVPPVVVQPSSCTAPVSTICWSTDGTVLSYSGSQHLYAAWSPCPP